MHAVPRHEVEGAANSRDCNVHRISRSPWRQWYFAREQGELGAAPEAEAEEHALLERIYRVVSPLERRPLIASSRTLVVAAKADRITPVGHARKLAVHFGSPLVSWHGGHLLQLGRNAAFRRVEALLRELRAKPI